MLYVDFFGRFCRLLTFGGGRRCQIDDPFDTRARSTCGTMNTRFLIFHEILHLFAYYILNNRIFLHVSPISARFRIALIMKTFEQNQNIDIAPTYQKCSKISEKVPKYQNEYQNLKKLLKSQDLIMMRSATARQPDINKKLTLYTLYRVGKKPQTSQICYFFIRIFQSLLFSEAKVDQYQGFADCQ